MGITLNEATAKSFRMGYPKFSMVVGKTPEFQTFRRFRRMRARLLLAKQDRVSQIEQKLDEIDGKEHAELFLGNMRRDKNQERRSTLEDLDEALADYGGMFDPHFTSAV